MQGPIARPRAIHQINRASPPSQFPRRGSPKQSSTMSDNNSLFARHYIDYVYAPGLLLVVGTLIVKKEWAPWALLVAIAFGLYNFMAFRKLPPEEISSKSMSTNLESHRRGQDNPQARCLSRVRARGENHRLSQCRHVCRPPSSLCPVY